MYIGLTKREGLFLYVQLLQLLVVSG